MTKHLTTREVAERLSVHPMTVLRMVKDGRLKSIKYSSKDYRYSMAEIEALERRGNAS